MITLLEFRRDGAPRFRVRLSRSETRIGRGARCDVTLPEEHVSRTHFVVRRDGDRWSLLDRSRNGTFVGGRAVEHSSLEVGDVIALPPWEIAVVAGDDRGQPETAVRDLLSASRLLSSIPSNRALVVSTGEMRVRDGPAAGERYVFRKPEVTVGSDPACDWVLPGDLAPHHFTIRVDDGRFLLLDHGGDTRVDGRVVDGGAELAIGAAIEAGDSHLVLVERAHEDPIRPLDRERFGELVGAAPSMRALYQLIRRVGAAPVPALVLGESGTGKELVARALHAHSQRADGPFVAVNCGAISRELVESELFGHEKGAFTGATGRRAGAFREADGGTLFLDEIGDLAPAAQVRFLRALETGTVRPVGADREVTADVRVIAATHRDLPAEVARGRFREDLFFRLAVGLLRVPPLRARREDIPRLVRHFLDTDVVGGPMSIDDEAMALLCAQAWRGNVRALRNVLLRAALLADSGHIGCAQLSFDLADDGADEPLLGLDANELTGTLEHAERTTIRRALDAAGGNRTAAARTLGIAKSTLHVKLKRYGLEEYRAG